MAEFVTLNGVETAWSFDGPQGAPVVIFAPGLAADMTMWEPQVAALAANYRVLRYDLRGHGGSNSTPGDYSLDLLSRDVLVLMDSLGVERAHFIGTSLGGMIGQYMGVHHAGRLRSLILCATATETPRAMWAERVAAVRSIGVAPIVEASLARWFTPAFRAARPDVMRQMAEMILRTSQEGYAGCAAAIRDMDLIGVISRIPVPVLVVAAEQDTSTPLEALERTAALIPDARLVYVAKAAHMPNIEQPEACNVAFVDFLRNLDGRGNEADAAATREPAQTTGDKALCRAD